MLLKGEIMLVAILVLSFLIFFHELGHFIMARLLGVKVEVFSIGFGKKLFCKKWGETSYCLSAIPLGGYVQMKGQDDTNPTLKN
jgi:regulator of sigma E protease